jgi:hypothetical protein
MSVPESTDSVLAAPRRRSTFPERAARRAARRKAAADAVRAYLISKGARFSEVTVSQRQIAADTGLSVQDVASGAASLSYDRRIVFDRPSDTMQPYTYRVVR